MRCFVGYLWCALLSVSVAFAEPQVLSYEDLITSWNDAMANSCQSWEYQETIPDLLASCNPTPCGDYGTPECVIPDSYSYFSSHLMQPLLRTNTLDRVPVSMIFLREPPSQLPAACVVDFDGSTYEQGYLRVSESNIEWRSTYTVPVPWEHLSSSIAYAQSGHMPVVLAILTYPGFMSWASSHISFISSQRVTNTSDSLFTRTNYAKWDRILREWAPTVYSALGYFGSTNYYLVPPTIRYSWSPTKVVPNLHPYPFYPGPFWYQNLNRLNPDGTYDYVLSPDALRTLSEEFADYDMVSPFGTWHEEFYCVIPVDSGGNVLTSTRVRILATVSEKDSQ